MTTSPTCIRASQVGAKVIVLMQGAALYKGV